MKAYTLITGASSGLGYEFARLARSENRNLILVSQDFQRLTDAKERLLSEHPGTAEIECLTLDLSDISNLSEISDHLKKKQVFVETLVNNAGFGDYGLFQKSDLEKQLKMINLNVTMLTALTHLVLPDMIQKKHGKILNIASTAAFLPGPLMSVYYSTKHYVLTFSESIHEDLRGSGVSVTAFCPGPTATNFAKNAQASKIGIFSRKLPTAERVAAVGWEAMKSGKAISLADFSSSILVFMTRLFPRSLQRRVVKKAQR